MTAKSWSDGFGRYLDDTVAGCEQKSSDFEERQKLRAEELEAIKKAIEIISGGVSPAHEAQEEETARKEASAFPP